MATRGRGEVEQCRESSDTEVDDRGIILSSSSGSGEASSSSSPPLLLLDPLLLLSVVRVWPQSGGRAWEGRLGHRGVGFIPRPHPWRAADGGKQWRDTCMVDRGLGLGFRGRGASVRPRCSPLWSGVRSRRGYRVVLPCQAGGGPSTTSARRCDAGKGAGAHGSWTWRPSTCPRPTAWARAAGWHRRGCLSREGVRKGMTSGSAGAVCQRCRQGERVRRGAGIREQAGLLAGSLQRAGPWLERKRGSEGVGGGGLLGHPAGWASSPFLFLSFPISISISVVFSHSLVYASVYMYFIHVYNPSGVHLSLLEGFGFH